MCISKGECWWCSILLWSWRLLVAGHVLLRPQRVLFVCGHHLLSLVGWRLRSLLAFRTKSISIYFNLNVLYSFVFVVCSLALVSGLCIGFFLVWRYKNRDKNSSSNKHSVGESLLRVTSTNNPSSSSSSSGPSTSGKRYMDSFAPFAYKQLNEQVFEEKRVDDNTIMVNKKQQFAFRFRLTKCVV